MRFVMYRLSAKTLATLEPPLRGFSLRSSATTEADLSPVLPSLNETLVMLNSLCVAPGYFERRTLAKYDPHKHRKGGNQCGLRLVISDECQPAHEHRQGDGYKIPQVGM